MAANKDFSIRLLQPPLEISINLPNEANAGEEITVEIEIISNAKTLIKDLALKVEYPAGFGYLESDLKPASGDNIWRLGDFEPNKKRTLKIKGVLEGQDLMELAFRALAGPLDENREVIPYGFSAQSLTLKKPFLTLKAVINDKEEGAIVSEGENVKVDVFWQNTLPVNIHSGVIEVKIKSPIVNERTISVSNGFYRSFDQTLVWNLSSLPELASIEPLAQGKAQFRFSILDPIPSEIVSQGNLTIPLDIEMRAERVTEEQGSVEIKNHFKKEIKLATLFQIKRRGLYYSGPFKNSGPLPPKVGKETTYTVVWSLSNTSNVVSEAKVSAFFPSYVKWLGVISPENAEVSYDEKTGEIVWQAGTIPIGAGVIGSTKELAFQISFLPNASQIGSPPILVSEVTLAGKDNFTSAFLRDTRSAMTTFLDTDSQFQYNESFVVQ